MRQRPFARAAAAPLVVALPISAACSSDDGTDGVLETRTSGPTDPTTTTAGDDVATTEPPAATEPGETTEGTGGEGGPSTPLDQDLDFDQRHPNGTRLTVRRVSFDGDDILIDVEVVNSGHDQITFHDGGTGGDRLRLVDDAGEEYNFVEAPHEETPFLDDGAIYLEPGETVSGTLAFRGPLFGEPGQLRLVTNVRADDIPAYDIGAEYEGTYAPGFVVPIDLTWQ